MRKTILIADDSSLNRTILETFFCENYATLPAADGEETVQLLAERESEIALILLDLIMPKRNGFEVLQWMKERQLQSRIPVIVITGSTDYQDELRGYNLGASDIIHKPFIPQIVLKRAENVMELFAHRAAMEEELDRRTRELEAAHTFDLLTGLYNMQHFLTKANEVLRASDKDGTWSDYAFLYSNIRNFKFYNLTNGMENGDRVLKMLAANIKKNGSPESLHSRFGNDHMISMVPFADCMDYVQMITEIFTNEFGNTSLKMKVGIYHVTAPGTNAAAACDFAKVACDTIYDSTESVCLYTDQIAHQISISNYVVSHLDEAIEKGYLQVYYQPVIRTISGVVCGMEALARWIDPVMGFLSPVEFIPALERNHLITKLDLQMLRLICREMKRAGKAKRKLVPVSFNLSRIDLLECDIFTEVEGILQEYSIPRDLINIEITESTMMERPEYMRQIIASFRTAGYQVWMDDFGSEYSSLNSLKDYRFDEIKLDMKFLSKFDDTCKKIIKSVIRMAKDLGVQTLAEGVETQEQLDFLRSVGCEKAQGYYFSRPLPLEEMYEVVRANGGHVESRAWRSYYHDIGAINFITERSLAVVEFDGSTFRYLFANEAYREIWPEIGAGQIEVMKQIPNTTAGILGAQIREIHKALHKGDGRKDLIVPIRRQYIRLVIQCLSEYENYRCYAVEMTNLSHEIVGLFDRCSLTDTKTDA